MSEQRKAERVRVLGVQVDSLKVERAALLTSRYLEKHKFEYIVFANTPAALAGQDEQLQILSRKLLDCETANIRQMKPFL